MNDTTLKVNDKTLDLFIANNFNVLLKGKHGVGKTAMIKEAFDRNNLNWRYFSASTMDPWVDFVGIPRETVDEHNNPMIELIRPQGFHDDSIEAIFFDEFNRAPPKIINAVMELIQFKSVNGHRFPNLKMVWAAINPEDEDEELSYDVEILDPAQKDRFQIILDVPYLPSKQFFQKHYGESGIGAVEWWKTLTPEQSLLVSPRRLEYAIQVFNADGDIRDVLPNKELNLKKLRSRLANGSIKVALEELYEERDDHKTKVRFSNGNFADDALNTIKGNDDYMEYFFQFYHKDLLSKMLTENDAADAEQVVKHTPDNIIAPIIGQIISTDAAGRNTKMALNKLAKEYNLDIHSEDAFRQAIDDSLKTVHSGDFNRAQRFSTLHTVSKRFNYNSPRDLYEDCVEYLAILVSNVEEKTLYEKTKPYKQVGETLVKKLNTVLKKSHDTTITDVFNDVVYPRVDKDDVKKDVVEKFFKLALEAPDS